MHSSLMDSITNVNVPFINTFMHLKKPQTHLDMCKICLCVRVYVYRDVCSKLSKDLVVTIVEITLDNYL